MNLSGIGNTVSHNEIYNAPHMGVYYTGNENVMEYNYIHDVVYNPQMQVRFIRDTATAHTEMLSAITVSAISARHFYTKRHLF